MPTVHPGTSLGLLERLRDGSDSAAWDRLVVLYTPLLRACFAAAGLQPADRDDLTQRAFEILLRRLAEFEHNGRSGAFRAWLRSIASNLLREFWRAREPNASVEVLEEMAESSVSLSKWWDSEHDQAILTELMDIIRPEFTDSTWQAFEAIALEGSTSREAAKKLGISVNAVLIAKSRVLARLRKEAEGLVD